METRGGPAVEADIGGDLLEVEEVDEAAAGVVSTPAQLSSKPPK